MKKTLLHLLCAAAVVAGAVSGAGATDAADRFARKLHTFNSIVKELETNYVDTLAVEELMDGAIGALLYQIDPYTEYYPADNQDELLALSEGSYAGIGSIISKRGDNVLISNPYWNSPARRTGLRHGDIIRAVDGDTVTAATDISSVSRRLRGQAGTKVRVDIARPYIGPDSLMSFEIVRGSIVTEPMPYYGLLPDSVGYIVLTQFSESAARDVKRAVTELAAAPGLKGIILDLRDNGGGLLEGAVQTAGLFVPKGTEILRTRGRQVEERIYRTTQQPVAPDVPLVVLVNGHTASSSEIVSGSLQDLDRAVIMGERTFGKGLVQSPRPLPYDDVLKITTARYYIPSGRLIQALNYAERTDEGLPTRTPDSLTTAYLTRAGRTVRDGGGITPDTVVAAREYSRLALSLGADSRFFDFANKVYNTDPAPKADDAVLVDSATFEAFARFVADSGFNYDRNADRMLRLLRDAVKAEGYADDSVTARIDALEEVLHRDLAHDLEGRRDEIMMVLDSEIGSRYFNDGTVVARGIDGDHVVARARALLHNPAEYRRILSAPQK